METGPCGGRLCPPSLADTAVEWELWHVPRVPFETSLNRSGGGKEQNLEYDKSYSESDYRALLPSRTAIFAAIGVRVHDRVASHSSGRGLFFLSRIPAAATPFGMARVLSLSRSSGPCRSISRTVPVSRL